MATTRSPARGGSGLAAPRAVHLIAPDAITALGAVRGGGVGAAMVYDEPAMPNKTDEPERLTARSYWHAVHTARRAGAGAPAGSLLRRGVGRVLGGAAMDFIGRGGYTEFLITETVLAPFLPVRADWRLLEVGSAPGRRLVRLHRRFAYDAFGVEYTREGVEANRRAFAAAGLDPLHVIHADFFSEDFQRQYRAAFDVVYSNGFIEHFSDARPVVEKHLGLLKPGGRLVILIPNLRGLNLRLARFFHPEVVALHNLAIMDRPAFRRLFDGLGLEALHCGYVGFFTLKLQNTRPGSWKRHLLRAGWKVETVCELAWWKLLGRRHLACRWSSPYLVFIGEKSG